MTEQEYAVAMYLMVAFGAYWALWWAFQPLTRS